MGFLNWFGGGSQTRVLKSYVLVLKRKGKPLQVVASSREEAQEQFDLLLEALANRKRRRGKLAQ